MGAKSGLTSGPAKAALCAGLIAVGTALAACDATPGATITARPITYGADDRREAYEVDDAEGRDTLEGSMVALVPRALAGAAGGFAASAPTLAAADDLCPGQPFAAQPTAAFCTGVLVDWDLVLTAGHCVRLYALADFVVVRGYYYDAPGHLAVSPGGDDVQDVAGVVAEALDGAGAEPRLDFALVRLARPVGATWRPAPVRVRPAAVADGLPITAIAAGGGLPLKLDRGGHIRHARQDRVDYFVADTDTAHGASGGGAFDASMALLGVLARGAADLVPTSEGCNVTANVPDGEAAAEEFTYAFRAVEALCEADPNASSLCRADCGEVCVATPLPPATGCALAGGARSELGATGTWLVLLVAARARGRRRRRRLGRLTHPDRTPT